MKEIVKVLLAEGIDEETIHEVLSILEVSKDYITKKREHAKDEAARCLVNSYEKGIARKDEVATKYFRNLFDESKRRIKRFDKKAKEYLEKKESNK